MPRPNSVWPFSLAPLRQVVDVFAKDFLLVPINFSTHWSLVIIGNPGCVPLPLPPKAGPLLSGGVDIDMTCDGYGDGGSEAEVSVRRVMCRGKGGRGAPQMEASSPVLNPPSHSRCVCPLLRLILGRRSRL